MMNAATFYPVRFRNIDKLCKRLIRISHPSVSSRRSPAAPHRSPRRRRRRRSRAAVTWLDPRFSPLSLSHFFRFPLLVRIVVLAVHTRHTDFYRVEYIRISRLVHTHTHSPGEVSKVLLARCDNSEDPARFHKRYVQRALLPRLSLKM